MDQLVPHVHWSLTQTHGNGFLHVYFWHYGYRTHYATDYIVYGEFLLNYVNNNPLWQLLGRPFGPHMYFLTPDTNSTMARSHQLSTCQKLCGSSQTFAAVINISVNLVLECLPFGFPNWNQNCRWIIKIPQRAHWPCAIVPAAQLWCSLIPWRSPHGKKDKPTW